MIQYTKEILQHLSIPSIPVREWDGKTSFKQGVAVTTLAFEQKAYAVCTYDCEKDEFPRIIKTFAREPFFDIEKIFVIPAFMNTDVETMDLDDESKKAADLLAQEVNEMTQQETQEEKEINEMQQLSEWIFPEIENSEQARAWIQAWNNKNHIKRGKIPTNEETLKLRLLAIWNEINKKTK